MITSGEFFNYKSATLFFGKKHDKNLIPLCTTVKQVHDNKVVIIENIHENNIEADALVTRLPNVNLCVKSADCVPILLYSDNGIIAAAHAGWRGAASGIIQNTIDVMVKLGGNTSMISAFIGPCIRKESYEVNENVFYSFTNVDKEQFFQRLTKTTFAFDLPGLCKNILAFEGISDIYDTLDNTYSQFDEFFSYRFYTKHDKILYDFERHPSIIRLNVI